MSEETEIEVLRARLRAAQDEMKRLSYEEKRVGYEVLTDNKVASNEALLVLLRKFTDPQMFLDGIIEAIEATGATWNQRLIIERACERVCSQAITPVPEFVIIQNGEMLPNMGAYIYMGDGIFILHDLSSEAMKTAYEAARARLRGMT